MSVTNTNGDRPRICFVVSAPETASTFLNPHIEALSEPFDVDVIANAPSGRRRISERAKVVHVPIERSVNPMRDLHALRCLRKALRQGGYAAVHSVTPKAGLLTAMATPGLAIPIRIHWFTGQVWATRRGMKRALLKLVDKFIASRCTTILVDSPSQRDFLIDEHVIRPSNSLVLGDGSICGVDTERFRPNRELRAQVRHDLGIPEDAIVILFVGRITRDKGVLVLAQAFANLNVGEPAFLLLVGSDEESLLPEVLTIAGTAADRVLPIGPTASPERYMTASDIFCLPSFREGFGLSVIEAAASGLPCVASRIYGLTDAVEDGMTGVLVTPRDPDSLRITLEELGRHREVPEVMGADARTRAVRTFGQERLTEALKALYLQLVEGLHEPIRTGTRKPRTR